MNVTVDAQRFREAVWAVERENFRPGDALDALDRAKVESPPWLLPEHIVGVGDICRLAGIQRGTLLAWRRDRGFPEPIAKLAREEVWDLRAVKDWMRRR